MKIIMTIIGVMAIVYVYLLIHSCRKAVDVHYKSFDDLYFEPDNDGRRSARVTLNPVYSLNVMEFSEFDETYYMVTVKKNGMYHHFVDYCSRDEVCELMEKYTKEIAE